MKVDDLYKVALMLLDRALEGEGNTRVTDIKLSNMLKCSYAHAIMLLDRALEDNTQVTDINNAYYLQLHQLRQALMQFEVAS